MKNKTKNITRRQFVKFASTGVAALPGLFSLSSCSKEINSSVEDRKEDEILIKETQSRDQHDRQNHQDTIPRRILGKTGLEVSLLAFGGGSQFLQNKDGEWEPMMERALDLGINYFDTSYSYGTEERYGELLSPIRDQVIITTKFDSRNVSGMKTEFEGSLQRLKTDYVDVLMIHSISKNDNVSIIEKGVYKEMVRLKQEGTAKFIGFSSMNSAERSKELIEKLDFDVALIAMNATQYGDFVPVALPSAIEKNVGVLAMKVMKYVVGVAATAEELLHYALDQNGVASAVVGHYGMGVLEENVRLVKEFSTSTGVAFDRSSLEKRLKPYAGPHILCWARPDYYDGKMV